MANAFILETQENGKVYDERTASNNRKFLRVRAKPGGWMSVWGSADIAFIKKNGGGPYTGTIEQEGDFKNLSNVNKAEPEQVPQEASQNGQNAQAQRQAGSDFRSPEQIIRSVALHEATELAKAFISNTPNEPALEEVSQIVLDWAEVFSMWVQSGSQKSPQRVISEIAPKKNVASREDGSLSDPEWVYNRFWYLAQQGWDDDNYKIQANEWLKKIGFDPFDRLSPERRREALVTLSKEMEAHIS